MPVTFCDSCATYIDLDEDVEHFEDHGQDQDDQKNWLEEVADALEMHEANEPEYQQ